MDNQEMFKNANLLRGVVINQCIMIERVIDVCLSVFFTNSGTKRDTIVNYVFSASGVLSFDTKRQILEDILKDFYPELFKKHKSELRELQNHIITTRNRFAHDHMEYENLIENGFGLVKIKNKQIIKNFGLKELEEFSLRTGRITKSVQEILIFLNEAVPQVD